MSKDLRLGKYLETWLEDRAGLLRPRTVEQYDRLIRLHVRPIAEKKLRKVGPKQITQLLVGLAESGKERTAEQVFVLLNTALSEAKRRGLVEDNPMDRVLRPSHRPEPHRIWTTGEQRAVLTALCGDEYEVEILLGLFCGLRRGEICGLMWEDIDFGRGMIHIRRQMQRQADGRLHLVQPKSAAGIRDIPVPKALLGPLMARRASSGPVARCTPDSLSKVLLRVERRAGVPHIGLHGLRHTFATNAVRAGVSLRVVQAIVGHSSFALTAQVYTHPDAEMLREAVDTAARSVV